MKSLNHKIFSYQTLGLLSTACATVLLSACGGGDSASMSNVATGTTVMQLQAAATPAEAAVQLMQPAFHVAPVILDEPRDHEIAPNAAPKRSFVPQLLAGFRSQRLTAQTLHAAASGLADPGTQAAGIGAAAKPMAAGSAVSTYSPAQIRAAYGMPALPASLSGLSSAQAAQLGAGQTIYIVDAQSDPNAATELAAFNTRFALPACTVKPIATNASLPLARPSANSCDFSIVYSTAAGTMTSSAPAYDSGWATEIALDVQWAHATAPLARIVLIEAPGADINSLLGAVQLANSMGPGVVSMSFGGPEGSWTSSEDSYFSGTGMTYLAATGDNGSGVSWPSVSSKVVAVGGTTLTYSGSGPRSEVAWSGTGGGVSAYTSTPSYQTPSVPGMGNPLRRTVADVAFNADPASGQYVVSIAPGTSAQSWLSAGGTSLSTPQWAGLMAIGNALRVQGGKSVIGEPHSVLYQQIATVASTYSSVFADVTKGSDGSCATCTAKTGYDPLAGLGTPNTTSLLSALSGAALPVAPPQVNPATISGQVGTTLSFTVSANGANPLTYALTGAPSGMVIGTTGIVTWPTPVLGNYAVTAIAKDSKTGLSGQAVYTINIAAPQAPAVTAATINGVPTTALSYAVNVSSPHAPSFTLAGAPAGMAISSTGVLTWSKPIIGNYSVTVTAKDNVTGLSGSAVMTIKIASAPPSGPSISAPAVSGTAGKPLSATITITDPGAASLSVSISGVPLGMTFSANGLTLTAYWAAPVSGTYSLLIQVQDSAGRSAQATMPITIK